MRRGSAEKTEADNVIVHISQKDTKQCSTILSKHKGQFETHAAPYPPLRPDSNAITRTPLPGTLHSSIMPGEQITKGHK